MAGVAGLGLLGELLKNKLVLGQFLLLLDELLGIGILLALKVLDELVDLLNLGLHLLGLTKVRVLLNSLLSLANDLLGGLDELLGVQFVVLVGVADLTDSLEFLGDTVLVTEELLFDDVEVVEVVDEFGVSELLLQGGDEAFDEDDLLFDGGQKVGVAGLAEIIHELVDTGRVVLSTEDQQLGDSSGLGLGGRGLGRGGGHANQEEGGNDGEDDFHFGGMRLTDGKRKLVR